MSQNWNQKEIEFKVEILSKLEYMKFPLRMFAKTLIPYPCFQMRNVKKSWDKAFNQSASKDWGIYQLKNKYEINTKRWLTAALNDHIIELLSKCKAKGKIKVFMISKVKKYIYSSVYFRLYSIYFNSIYLFYINFVLKIKVKKERRVL